MELSKIKSLIDSSEYWDMRVKKVECSNYADEVIIEFDDSEGSSVCFEFSGCFKSIFDHVKDYNKNKPTRELLITQLPYFMQDVNISEAFVDNNHLWIFKINMFPLFLEIWCKEIKIYKPNE